MSDDEDRHEEEEEAEAPAAGEAEPSGPTEAEVAMQKRRSQQPSSQGLDEAAQELLEENRQMRKEMEKEIQEMRERSERRKREREEEEKRIAAERAEEEARRKAEEDERKRKKEDEEGAKRDARAAKMAEFKRFENPEKRNFIITKREGDTGGEDSEEGHVEQKKSKEQLEAEKQAILAQRIQPCDVNSIDASKLGEKAKELHTLITRLEGEKYDLEKRFKTQQVEMQEMAERARQMTKVGKGEGCIKRVATKEDEVDKIQERFAGAPAKIMMYSAFERQKDKRSYDDRHTLFIGPVYGYPAERIAPTRSVTWNDQGQPQYVEEEVAEGAPAAVEAEEE